MTIEHTPRLNIPRPDESPRSDSADVPRDFKAALEFLDSIAVIFGQGLLASRPVSTGGSPGIEGRIYYATDNGLVYYDYGTGWIAIGVLPPWHTADYADLSVTTAKLADLAVTTAKLADASITTAKILDGTIAATDLADILVPSRGAAGGAEALRALGWGAGLALGQSQVASFHQTGTFAGMPAANSVPVGVRYWASDIGVEFQTNGTTWDPISTGGAARVTALPGSPINGMVVEWVDSVNNPTWVFHMRYNANRTTDSGNKWEYVGGLPVHVTLAVFSSVHSAGGATVDSATAFTIPRAGVWRTRIPFSVQIVDFQGGSGVNASANISLKYGATVVDQELITLAASAGGFDFFLESGSVEKEAAAALNDTVKLNVGSGGNNGFQVTPKTVEIYPIRVSG